MKLLVLFLCLCLVGCGTNEINEIPEGYEIVQSYETRRCLGPYNYVNEYRDLYQWSNPDTEGQKEYDEWTSGYIYEGTSISPVVCNRFSEEFLTLNGAIQDAWKDYRIRQKAAEWGDTKVKTVLSNIKEET